MPADFLSRSQFDEVVAKNNAKAIAAAIDPFTPSLAEEQASDSDMIKFKQFVVKKSWPLGTSKSDKARLVPLLSKFFTRDGLVWVRLSDFERQRVALYLPLKF